MFFLLLLTLGWFGQLLSGCYAAVALVQHCLYALQGSEFGAVLFGFGQLLCFALGFGRF